MGDGEMFVAIVCTVTAVLGWGALLVTSGSISRGVAGPRGSLAKTVLALAPIVALVIIAFVLRTIAAHDVRDDARYLWMYGAMGLAVVRVAIALPTPAGVNASRDAVEARNVAAAWAYVATAAAYALAFSGANVGDGPGFEVVVLTFALSCGTLYLFHAAIEAASRLASRVTSDRSAAAAWRLSSLMIAAGAICGRGACGNWYSFEHTVQDFFAVTWVLPIFIVIEAVPTRLMRPRPEDGVARFAAFLAGIVYLTAAFAYIYSRGPW